MNPLLAKLGISPEAEAFFHAESLCFDYGGVSEVYEEGYHYVPTTDGLWLAGNRYAQEVVITNSAMQAIAWYAIHRSRYADPAALTLVSLGNLPTPAQLSWLRSSFRRRKFTLVFDHSMLGNLTDIKAACLLKGKTISLCWQKEKTAVSYEGRTVYFDENCCSLHHFEKAFDLRLGIRTSKPALHTTYLTQLQDDSSKIDYPQTRP
ncbi:hypothetical protein HH214_08625 [Mucilaginibacter robiniae]|uniref:Uncharacterized protein n=1 Tax=Mucilaginibacter robiniae TaxID=2728022 RepID=A0A7L5E526_9SPHI|nr:hypothetical protein [Mucilaginibacter robiniae]QJD95933.1 hypothetical protein HH214_08625 [Mucilaginibacter robiniae]